MKQEKNETGLAGHNTYQSPMTYRNRVETEGGLCTESAAITNDDSDNGKINKHEINTDGPSFGNIKWDDVTTTD